jgi:hypothetical protein
MAIHKRRHPPKLSEIFRDRNIVDKEIVVNRFLTTFGKLPAKENDISMATPLHIAVTSDVGRTASNILLGCMRRHFHAHGQVQLLPLHYSLRHGDPSRVVTDVLLGRYAEGARVTDKNSLLPLHAAAGGLPLKAILPR